LLCTAHDVFLLSPKVLCESVERIGRSRFGFGGVDPWVAVHPESPVVIGLTGALTDLTEATLPVGFCSGKRIGVFPTHCVCSCFKFRAFWSLGVWNYDFQAHRSDC
jgi:hypothetical protein